MRVNRYMHTLDGKPAYFDDVTRDLYFCTRNRPVVLVESLKKLRRQQRTSAQVRRAEGFPLIYPMGYQRVEVES